jgi:enoyl-CoA hydratase/carnithine racemase
MPSPILHRHDEAGVATLTLNRPEARNALSTALMTDLLAELEAIEADDTTRAVVIAGAGLGFCAGHDLRELRETNDHEPIFALCSRLMLRITTLRCPVIARVHGIATAAGCQLVATCDLAVAAEGSRFATPGVNIGLFCSTPMVALSRAVGRKAAMEMLLTGEMIGAKEAKRRGLINRVAAPADLVDETAALAGAIAAKSRFTVAIGKQAFYRQAEMGLKDAYEYTAAVMVRNMAAKDAAEGIDAFLQKRFPVWADA